MALTEGKRLHCRLGANAESGVNFIQSTPGGHTHRRASIGVCCEYESQLTD
jgi:hypothetical protein